MSLYNLVGLTLASSAVYAASHGYRPSRINTLVIFGDSYSDVGNTYRLSNETYPPSYYYNGHFSNGPIWPEYIQKFTHSRILNYAYGGATVNNKVIQGYSGFSGDLPVPSIADQIETHREFIESNPNEIHTRSTLYVVVESGNDYIYGGPTVTPELVAKNIYRTSKALFELPFSAKHFMYANIALDHLPFSMSLNATTRDLVRLSRQKHNRILKTLFRSNTELKAKVFDMNGFLEEELSSRRYVNAKNSCIQTSNVLNVIPKICKNPDKKVFWDLFHLTTTAHRRLAHAIIKDAASLSIGIDSFGY